MKSENLKGIIVLLLLSIGTAFLYNHYSPHGIALIGQWDTNKGVVHAISKNEESPASLEILDTNIVEEIIKNKTRILIDVRHKDSYDMGHLPGALNFPLNEFEENFQQMIKTISATDPLLIYCSSSECSDSHSFAQILINMKFTDVKIFSKGFMTWEEEGRRIINNEN